LLPTEPTDFSSIKKVREGGRKMQFSADNCRFLTEEIMGAQNFNIAPKSPENWETVLLKEHFSTRKKFSDWLKFRRSKESNCPPATTPLVFSKVASKD